MTIETLSKQTVEIAEAELGAKIMAATELAEQADNQLGLRSTAEVKGYAAAAHELMEIHAGVAPDDDTLTPHQHIRALLTAGKLSWHAGSNIGQRDAAMALRDYAQNHLVDVPEHLQSYRAIRALFVPLQPRHPRILDLIHRWDHR